MPPQNESTQYPYNVACGATEIAQNRRSHAGISSDHKDVIAELCEQGSRCLVSIEKGGPIEIALRKGARAESHQLATLSESLLGDLERIRRHAGSIGLGTENVESMDRSLAGFLNGFPISYNVVLLYILAKLEESKEWQGKLLAEAQEAFRLQPFDYCDSFGEFLPDEFRRLADDTAYRDGLNATAQDDFLVFTRRLQALRGVVADRGLIGMPTGLKQLDDTISGVRGLTFLGGPKGIGKTWFMLSTVRATLQRCSDAAVLILSFDEPKDRLYQRLLCLEAGCSLRDLLTPSDELRDRLRAARRDLSDQCFTPRGSARRRKKLARL